MAGLGKRKKKKKNSQQQQPILTFRFNFEARAPKFAVTKGINKVGINNEKKIVDGPACVSGLCVVPNCIGNGNSLVLRDI